MNFGCNDAAVYDDDAATADEKSCVAAVELADEDLFFNHASLSGVDFLLSALHNLFRHFVAGDVESEGGFIVSNKSVEDNADAARDDCVTFDILISEISRDDGVVQFELPATAVAVEP